MGYLRIGGALQDKITRKKKKETDSKESKKKKKNKPSEHHKELTRRVVGLLAERYPRRRST